MAWIRCQVQLHDLAGARHELTGGFVVESPLAQADSPRTDWSETGDPAQEGGFPGSIRAKDADDLTGREADVGVEGEGGMAQGGGDE